MEPTLTTESKATHPHDTSSTANISSEYDFVVIGGGTAGLTVASRLTENPKVQVLVIEAGANRLEDPKILTPGLAFSLYNDPNYDWSFLSVPQEELYGRQVLQQRGKVLGWSSAIFLVKMVYNSKSACDVWEMMGSPGWNWDTMLPYYHRFHSQAPPPESVTELLAFAEEDEGVHSNEGPNGAPVDKAWYEAWKNIMVDLKYEGTGQGGFIAASCIDPKTKMRSYAGSAYYSDKISLRSNLRVITEAVVEKIIVQKGSEVTATGVQFVSESGERFVIRAKKEVILSAGVMQSPQILELSGIGSAEILKTHGVEVIVENPNVGEHLQDHPACAISFEVADGVPTADALLRDPKIFQSLLETYQKDRSGPLGESFSNSTQISLPETFGPAYEELKEEVLLHHLSQDDGATINTFFSKVQFDVSDPKLIHDENYVTLLASLNHPFSSGSIHINSPEPTVKPTFDPMYLSHPMDLEILARHIQFYSVVLSTQPLSGFFKPHGRRIPAEAFPNGTQPPTLEEAKDLVRRTLVSNYHPMGTCAMGKRDERLRVHGVKGLRIVDASIFPLMTRGNPITTVYAVAERAVDLIKEDWNAVK